MPIKIDSYDFEKIIAFFWQADEEKWEGVLSNQIGAGNYKVIKGEKAIIIFRNPRLPVTFSSESNQQSL
ncbi:MAG: hypothetical protein ACOX6E_02945 [Syntrophomonadaceae bacterium]|jgi:hypothetical protein